MSMLPNQILFAELEELIRQRRKVILPVKGRSMLPFLREGKDKVVLIHPDNLNPGDIVLVCLASGQYVMHRILQMDGEQLTLMGDGNVYGRETCTTKEVRAKVVTILRKGKEVSCSDPHEQRRVEIWKKLLPIRRYLLFIYRKLL